MLHQQYAAYLDHVFNWHSVFALCCCWGALVSLLLFPFFIFLTLFNSMFVYPSRISCVVHPSEFAMWWEHLWCQYMCVGWCSCWYAYQKMHVPCVSNSLYVKPKCFFFSHTLFIWKFICIAVSPRIFFSYLVSLNHGIQLFTIHLEKLINKPVVVGGVITYHRQVDKPQKNIY